MLTSALLVLYSALFAVLGVYAVVYVLGAARFLFVAPPAVPSPEVATASVTVLVPAFDEGPALVDTVETLLHQDYPGPILIRVLIKDDADTSLAPLRERYALGDDLTLRRDGVTLEVCLTGLQRKHDKINRALESLDSTYVAFLDADHRADPSWLSASVAILDGSPEQVAVQSRRAPLDARTLFQFWDSAENHLGNEVFNHLAHAHGQTCFFTGTTCVFRSSVFDDRGLPDSITEDTFLSYQLLCDGASIAYNGSCGSFEEVAPDFSSYIARRRRWSSGHNHTFFSHLPNILRGPLSWGRKLQLLLHGAFFLLPTLIVVLVNLMGVYFFLQLTTSVRLLAVILSLLVSGVLAYAISSDLTQGVQNTVLAFLWVFPQLGATSVFAYRLIGDELFFQIISFPYVRFFGPAGLALFLTPIAVLLVGAARLGRPSLTTTLLFLPTFPLILFLDVFAIYVGFMDRLLGRTVWGKIRRSNSIEASFLPEEMRSLLRGETAGVRGSRVLGGLLLVVVGVVAVNDLAVFDNCGHPVYLLGDAIVYRKTDFDTEMKVTVAKRAARPGFVEIETTVLVESRSARPVALSIRLGDDREEAVMDGTGSVSTTTVVPAGFATLDLDVELSGAGSTCYVDRDVSTTLRELRGGKLFLNGEEFLIKGVIPSFRTARLDLGLREGLAQIKALGANTVRVYHAPTPEMMDLAEELGLMLVVQPDESTWQNLDMEAADASQVLLGRYRDLVGATEGRPHVLIDNIGNELELVAPGPTAPRNIAKALQLARESEGYRFPLSYSTYAVYHPYPVDLLAVNMLDSGETYWRDAVQLLGAKHDAFYASEFGGFVAFYEQIDPLIRASRVDAYWRRLQEAGSAGAIFFQSHDNWAQPVVVGFNDPFNPEQPDDLRGLWDHENRPKLVHRYLKAIYADVDLELTRDGDGDGEVAMTNRRPYRLEDLVVSYGAEVVFTGTLEPEERVVLDHAPPAADPHRYALAYTSHRGLPSAYTIEVRDPAHLERPQIVNRFFRQRATSATRFDVELYGDDELRFLLPPSWERYRVAGREQAATDGVNVVRFAEPSQVECPGFAFRRSPEAPWLPVPAPFTEGGAYALRIELPDGIGLEDYELVIEGTGASELVFVAPDGSRIKARTHSYRENRIAMKTLSPALHGRVLVVRVVRNSTLYVAPELTPSGEPIQVSLKRPRLEKIHRAVLERIR